MDHVAVMKKSWNLIPKIISGEKTIESRWYQTKRVPWDRIQPDEVIFFKNSGEPVIARAMVSEVLQFEVKNIGDAQSIVKKYGKEICLINKNPSTWGTLPKYCILIRIKHPEMLQTPFNVDKKGFGAMAAWMSVDTIKSVTKRLP